MRTASALAGSYLKKAAAFEAGNKYDKCVEQLRKVIDLYPELRTHAYEWIASIRAKQTKWQEAVDAGQKAIEFSGISEIKKSVPKLHRNIGTALKQLGRNREAAAHFYKAIEGFKADLAKDPNSAQTIIEIGNAYAEKGDFARAAEFFKKAVDMEPFNADYRLLIAKTLTARGLYKDAIRQLQTDIQFLNENGKGSTTAQLQDFLKYLTSLENS